MLSAAVGCWSMLQDAVRALMLGMKTIYITCYKEMTTYAIVCSICRDAWYAVSDWNWCNQLHVDENWFTLILWTSGMFSLLYNVCMLLRLVDVHGIILCSQFHNLNWNTYSTFELLMISDASWWCMCHLMQKTPFIAHQWWH